MTCILFQSMEFNRRLNDSLLYLGPLQSQFLTFSVTKHTVFEQTPTELEVI